jgi:hypothetical protein
MIINTDMLSRINPDQLKWVNNYIQSVEYNEDIEHIKIFSIAGSKAIELKAIYTSHVYSYIIDLDGITLRKAQ